jgi:hypothetical protein
MKCEVKVCGMASGELIFASVAASRKGFVVCECDT